MAKKTAIRRLVKYLPLSPEIQKAVALDELADAGVPQTLDIEVEASEAVAEATERRQADLRARHGGGAAAEPSAIDVSDDTGESATDEQLAALNSLIDQLDATAGEGKGFAAVESAIGTSDLAAITATQAATAEQFLKSALASAKKPAATGKGAAPQGALV